MFGCGQPLLINIEHEVIFCLSKQASQIQGWRGFIMNSALPGTSLSLCWFYVIIFWVFSSCVLKECVLPLCASFWRLCLHEYVRGHLRLQCIMWKMHIILHKWEQECVYSASPAVWESQHEPCCTVLFCFPLQLHFHHTQPADVGSPTSTSASPQRQTLSSTPSLSVALFLFLSFHSHY